MSVIRKLYGEYTLIVMVLVLGLGMSVWTSWRYQDDRRALIVGEFHAVAQDRIELIKEKIDHNDIVMRSVAAFFRAADHVSRDDFAVFTDQLLKDYPYIHALEWIPRVEGAEREAYEAQAEYPGFVFTEKTAENKLVPSAVRDEYFPIYYIEPLTSGNRNIMGFDIFSDADRARAVQRMLDNRRPVVTGGVHLLSDPSVAAVIFYEPVIRTLTAPDGKDYERVTGLIGSVVPLAAMIDAAIKPLNYAGVNILIHDLSADGDENKLLYARSTRLRKIPVEEIIEDFQREQPLVERKTLEIGGREWQITVLPARGYFAMHVEKGAYIILLSGGLFTLLLVFYMFSRIRESERVNREVKERTAQLLQAKRETEMILLSTSEGVTGLDADGNITFCNPTANQLLGYSKKELIGQHHHTLVHGRYPDGTAYDIEACPIQRILDYGQSCNVRDEVFWSKDGTPVQIEYTGSPLLEGGEIAGAVLVFRDIAERRALEKQLEQMARYDQLTGLANRALFIEHLRNALARVTRARKKLAVIYLDLNGFKPINDTLGHAAGDMMLKEFAKCLREVVRDSDVPARMGGDEFTIVADNLADSSECLKLVERLQKRLEAPFEINGQHFKIGASVGIAFYPDHGAGYEELISAADTAMYQAKKDKSLPWVISGDAPTAR